MCVLSSVSATWGCVQLYHSFSLGWVTIQVSCICGFQWLYPYMCTHKHPDCLSILPRIIKPLPNQFIVSGSECNWVCIVTLLLISCNLFFICSSVYCIPSRCPCMETHMLCGYVFIGTVLSCLHVHLVSTEGVISSDYLVAMTFLEML